MRTLFDRRFMIWGLGGLLCALPFAILAFYVNRYGVNLPFSDQWELVVLLMKARAGGVEFSDLFAQHGEQRMLFPRLIMLVLAPLTGWNIRAELFLNLILAAGIFLLLVLLLLRSAATLGAWAVLPASVLSLMVFSPVQWENWFWGWQISWYLPLLLFVLAAAVLWLWPEDRPAWPALAIAITAALAGQYSLLSATLIWVTCLVIFFARDNLRKLWWVWALCGGISTAAYLLNYKSPPAMDEFHMPPSLLLEEPARPAAYLLYLLGRPVLDQKPSYLVGGVFLAAFLGVSAYFVLFRRDRLKQAWVWMVVGAYALCLGLMTTAGRLGIGLDLAGSSRYTTIGILFMAATAALATVAILPDSQQPEKGPTAVEAGRSVRIAGVVVMWACIGALYLADYNSEVKTLKMWHGHRLAIKQCLMTASSPQDPCLPAAYPAPQLVFERTQFLKSIGWGGFEVDHPSSRR